MRTSDTHASSEEDVDGSRLRDIAGAMDARVFPGIVGFSEIVTTYSFILPD
jgi:hypothetical protein